jgi:hypothetical protein
MNEEKTTYKVWLEIEQYDDRTGHSKDMDAPAGSLGTFLTYEEAWNYAEYVTRLATSCSDSTEEDESCDGRAMPQPTPERRPEAQEPTEPAPLDTEALLDVIFAYTRKDAIADGSLVDVSQTAREAGFKIPVALTRAVWSQYVEVPEGVECQDEQGRLWDVLWMCRFGITQGENRDASEFLYQLQVRNDNREGEPPLVTLKAVCGPDDASPCITIMLPDED